MLLAQYRPSSHREHAHGREHAHHHACCRHPQLVLMRVQVPCACVLLMEPVPLLERLPERALPLFDIGGLGTTHCKTM